VTTPVPYRVADAEDIMSVTSTSSGRPASVTIPEGVGFFVVLALVLVAIVAGAFVFLGHVPDAAAQAPYVGP